MSLVAALFVQTGGVYFNLPGVVPWDKKKDARKYCGPWPVVGHPPCARWCRLAGLVEARWGHKRGEDGGCFKSALSSVRTWGGVLEHPAYSDAWPHFSLPEPFPDGGWQRGICGGWACHVEQGRYGHPAKKATWLYAFGVDDLPTLRWGSDPDQESTALVSWCGNRVKSGESRPRLSSARAAATPPRIPGRIAVHRRPGGEVQLMSSLQRSRTPPEFRDVLLSIAKSAHAREAA